MIRSPSLQRFLLAAAKATDKGALRIIHELVRRIYLGPVLFFLSYALKPKGVDSRDFALIARHSSTQAGDFNAFMSDLDLSAVLSDEKIDAASEVVQQFYFWKQKLPFIGELELYARTELDELQKIFSDPNGVYTAIRRVRKLSWMENLLPAAPSAYHRFKAERSISKILSQEKIDYFAHRSDYRTLFSKKVEAWIASSFPHLLDQKSGLSIVQSDYYSTKIWASSDHIAQAGELCLPQAHAWILLALTPRAAFDDPAINETVRRLRADPTLRKQWFQISRIEVLVYRAVLRAQQTVTEGERGWLQGFIDSWTLSKDPL